MIDPAGPVTGMTLLLRSRPPNQANVADATDLAFFEVDFGTLKASFSLGLVGAANLQTLGHYHISATLSDIGDKKRMIDEVWAREFAQEWVEAWNSHNLDRILSHYSHDFEMSSPYIFERMQEPSGILKGQERVRNYWQKGVEAQPPLKFELIDLFVGVESITLYYRSVGRRMVCEVLFFNSEKAVAHGIAHHGGTGN